MRTVWFVEDVDGVLMRRPFATEESAQAWAQERRDRLTAPEKAWAGTTMADPDRVEAVWKERRRQADGITIRAVEVSASGACGDGHCGVCRDCRGTSGDTFRVWTETGAGGRPVTYKS